MFARGELDAQARRGTSFADRRHSLRDSISARPPLPAIPDLSGAQGLSARRQSQLVEERTIPL